MKSHCLWTPRMDPKFGFSLVVFLMISFSLQAQLYVDTVPGNKHVLIEEFTAVHCSYCPAGHELLDSLIEEHPGHIFGIAMHPANVAYTAPYTGSPDFRRSFLDAFFSVPFATDSIRFFPGAFVNRREWIPGRRERYTTTWRQEADSALHEPAPLNVGLHVLYNPQLGYYTVFTEVYCTDTVDFPMYLNVFMTEDSLIAEQNNGGIDYVHNHIFRESLTPQWGDSLSNYALPGTLLGDTIYFQDSAFQYIWSNSHFTAFVRNAVNEEVVNVAQEPVYDLILTDVSETSTGALNVQVFPNPFTESIYIYGNDMEKALAFSVFDLSGRCLFSGQTSDHVPARIDFPNHINGNLFLLKISSGNITQCRLLVRQ